MIGVSILVSAPDVGGFFGGGSEGDFFATIVSAQKDQALSIESEVNVGTPVIDECQPEKICPTQPNL